MSARGGFSLVEVLLVLGILAVGIVPVLQMYSSSHRIAHSAHRLSEVTLHAQSILEALAELSLEEFPAVMKSERTVLLADMGPAVAGGGPRFAQVVQFFQKKPPLEMVRMVTAERLAGGELLIRVQVEWQAVAGEDGTWQHIALPMVSTPRNWQ